MPLVTARAPDQEEPRDERVDDEHAAGEPLEAEHEQDEQD